MEDYKRWAAIVTGSRKYGKPRINSDIDLVVLVSPADLKRLRDAAAIAHPAQGEIEAVRDTRGTTIETAEGRVESDGQGEMSSGSFRFGMLNLVVTTEPDMFQSWVQGTKELKAKGKPVDRETATMHLRKLREVVIKARKAAEPPEGYNSLDDIPF